MTKITKKVFEEEKDRNKNKVKVRTEKGIVMMTSKQFDKYLIDRNKKISICRKCGSRKSSVRGGMGGLYCLKCR